MHALALGHEPAIEHGIFACLERLTGVRIQRHLTHRGLPIQGSSNKDDPLGDGSGERSRIGDFCQPFIAKRAIHNQHVSILIEQIEQAQCTGLPREKSGESALHTEHWLRRWSSRAAVRSGKLAEGLQCNRVSGDAILCQMKLSKAFTLLEPGPVVLVTTHDGKKGNIMTISWTMVVDFTPKFAITTGEWNHSFAALRKYRECVIAVPTVDLLDQVVGIGTCSGADTDKFARFKLTPVQGKIVKPPLIKECVANIECKVVDLIRKHDIVVLEGVAAYVDPNRKDKRTIHAVGDGTFVVDGRKLNRRKQMASKLPEGC
jgi:flavin reductase (DIM6/NTAB) family NADH-FMN oxidoreductase RutF